MKVLVVGGSGLVGAAAAAEFERRGYRVVCLSRGGDSPVGEAVHGDVRVPNLGLRTAEAQRIRDGLTHVVAAFGSVDWRSSPRHAVEVHEHGTRNVLRFASGCPDLERFVHVSSILVLGRTQRRVGNAELDVGQSWRNWYEYGKFLAESVVREERSVPWRALRLGPVLGPGGPIPPSATDGLLAAIPFLLRGYPLHLDRRGDYPCYPCDAEGVGRLAAVAAEAPGDSETWTWFDARMPTLAEVFSAICGAWGVVPRIVDARALVAAGRALGPRLGFPRTLVDYSKPWADIDPAVLDALPLEVPQCDNGYLEATGVALRRRARELVGSG